MTPIEPWHWTSVWFSLVENTALRGCLILLVAAVLSLGLRRASAALRHVLWLLSLIAVGILPLLSQGLPSLDLPVLPTTRQTGSSLSLAAAPSEPALATKTGPITSQVSSEATHSQVDLTGKPLSQQPSPPLTWQEWALLIWFMGVILFLLPPLVGIVGTKIYLRGCHRLRDEAFHQRVTQLAQRLGVTQLIQVVKRRGDADVPSVAGFMRPVLFWPASARDWASAQVESVLLHELAHVKRRDCLTQMVAACITALHWFNPLAWLALRQIRVESEKACDDLVLSTGVENPSYAQHLLNVVRLLQRPQRRAQIGLPMARTSQVEDRLLDILDADRRRAGLTRRMITVGILLVSLLALPIATMKAIAKPGDTPVLRQISGNILIGPEKRRASDVPLRITLFQMDPAGIPQTADVLYVRSDATGSFTVKLPETFQVDLLLLEALMPGYCIWQEYFTSPYTVGANEILMNPKGALPEDLHLMPSDYIKGRVVDEAGNGLPGVKVSAQLRDEAATYGVQWLETDQEGRFEIFRIPQDRSAYVEGYISFEREDLISARVEKLFTLADEQKRALEVVMQRGHIVSGTLTHDDGTPAVNVLVEATPLGKETATGRVKNWTYRKAIRTDEKGAFVLTGVTEREHEIQAIHVPSLQKMTTQLMIDSDMRELSLQLKPFLLPPETRPIEVLGMKVINLNDTIRDVFGITSPPRFGVLILDPGEDYERFQIGDLQPGDYFVTVGEERVRSVIDFIGMLLEHVAIEHGQDLNALPSSFRSNIRVVYGLRREFGVGTNTQYMELSKKDVLALKDQQDRLPGTRH